MKKDKFYKSSAWKWFSRYVLTYHAFKTNEGLMAKCATSGRLYPINSRLLHCGHFIPVYNGNSSNFSTAFDFRNVLPQSYAENHYKSGNPTEMRIQIDYIHGEGTADELQIKSKQPFKLDKYTLKMISNEYRIKFKELVKEKGNAWE